MNIPFNKYQALGNDFLIIESDAPPAKRTVGKLARAICDRRTGVGADGILYLSPSRKTDIKADVFNSDGSWAEKSGNGVRIVGLYLQSSRPKRKSFTVEMGGTINEVRLRKKIPGGSIIEAAIGQPDFRTKHVPMKSRSTHFINQPLKLGREKIYATCLAVGNPHCVVVVEDFNLDWPSLGCRLEVAPMFPRATNVEFVQVVNRHKIRVAEWERGAGPTGSSGTGAAAAVAALVIQGFVDRNCEVVFEPGSLLVNWDAHADTISLSGPVLFVASGEYRYR